MADGREAAHGTEDQPGFADDWRRLRRLADWGRARTFGHALVSSFAANNLLTYASAVSYQVLFAIVPFALVGLAVIGFLGVSEIWRDDFAPQIRERVSPAAFQVIESTVQKILRGGEGFWLTVGLAVAIWEVSGAVRAVTGALTRVYGIEEDRSFLRRMLVSLVLAVAAAVLVALAIATVQLGDDAAWVLADGAVARVFELARWPLALVLMLLLVGIVIRFAPAKGETSPWLGFGAVFVVLSWIVASVVFGWYATSVASYSSVFGSLAVVIVLMTYLYVSAVAFLVGVQMDALLRGVASGELAER